MWKGNDPSLIECVDAYGLVYQYDGEDFRGYVSDCPTESFAPFWIDNSCIDDYFAEEGDKIAAMCGVKQEDMDYEWKLSALISYYGLGEFVSGPYKPVSRDEVISIVKCDWCGNNSI